MMFKLTMTSELKVFLFIVHFALFVSFAIAQDVSKSQNVDTFFDLNCEGQRSYIDLLLRELNDSQETKGIIIIHAEPNDPITPYFKK